MSVRVRSLLTLAIALGALASATPAAALCSGDTFDREYAGADLVVRARLVSERLIHHDEPIPAALRRRFGADFPVMIYGLGVRGIYKGHAARTETLFQVWHSGRFPMDQGADYLLFLTRHPEGADMPDASQGAYYVRHACGQSKAWQELDQGTRSLLSRLPAGSAE